MESEPASAGDTRTGRWRPDVSGRLFVIASTAAGEFLGPGPLLVPIYSTVTV